MHGRILIIASWCGFRHETKITPDQMLKIQAEQLRTLKHSLDKIVVVQNFDPGLSIPVEYKKALEDFPNVLVIDNISSYHAWKAGFLANPDFEWYFFLEDDYTFFLDDFDQRMIDMWASDTTYLAVRVDEAGTPYGLHTSVSCGLTRGDILNKINWETLYGEGGEYSSRVQISWSQLFGEKGLKDIRAKYASPFWTGGGISEMAPNNPLLLGPMQML